MTIGQHRGAIGSFANKIASPQWKPGSSGHANFKTSIEAAKKSPQIISSFLPIVLKLMVIVLVTASVQTNTDKPMIRGYYSGISLPIATTTIESEAALVANRRESNDNETLKLAECVCVAKENGRKVGADLVPVRGPGVLKADAKEKRRNIGADLITLHWWGGLGMLDGEDSVKVVCVEMGEAWPGMVFKECALADRIMSNSRFLELLASMPKDEATLQDIMNMRMEKRTMRFLVQPSKVYWQVLGSGSHRGPASLLDNRKYLFNCGEGTQRVTNLLSISKALAQLDKLEHVFITCKTWKYVGGLLGVCPSVKAAGAPDITKLGPPGCMELYKTTERFLKLKDFDVYIHGVFEDGRVTVEQVVLHLCLDLPMHWKDGELEEAMVYDSMVQAYICHFSHKPGKLDKIKCVDLGVKPGPMLGMLKAGGDVTLDDGRVVKSFDVMAHAAPPSSFLVLDIPDLEFRDSLMICDKIRTAENIYTVFHFSPHEVVTSPRYRKWQEGIQSVAGKAPSSIFPVVTFLMTGGSVPGILVESGPGSFMMLDCGESTMSQLIRIKWMEGTEKILNGLEGVYVSHMHADHHLGLFNIIQLRERAFINSGREVVKLFIFSTKRLSEYLVTRTLIPMNIQRLETILLSNDIELNPGPPRTRGQSTVSQASVENTFKIQNDDARSVNYFQQISQEKINFIISPWGAVIMRNCSDVGDILEFNKISEYETFMKETKQSLWIYLNLKVFQTPTQFEVFGVFVCPQCASMSKMDGLQAFQDPDVLRSKMCFHSRTAGTILEDWRSVWNVSFSTSDDEMFNLSVNETT